MSRNIDVGTDVIDYDLDERHLPSSQVERIPFLEDHRGDELFSPSSLRANFIPIGAATQTLDCECHSLPHTFAFLPCT